MKKYKLIKCYPGSPEIGSIAEYNEYISYYSVFQHGSFHKKNIENHPEFWEEVISEYPKILAFRNIESINVIDLLENGNYKCKESADDGDLTLSHCLNLNYLEIYQIEVSSGKIFTIGDKFTFNGLGGSNWENKFDIILGFDYRRNGELAVKYHNGIVAVDKIISAKEPLFVTEDGIDIFDPTTNLWLVNPASCSMVEIKASQWDKTTETRLIFAIKENANKFIDENKPMFSKKQIKEALEYAKYEEKSVGYWILTDKIKQKLGI
jgi:hypothetical protein